MDGKGDIRQGLPPMSNEMVQSMLEYQSQKIDLDAKAISLKEKELEIKGKNAMEAMRLQADYMRHTMEQEMKRQRNLYLLCAFGGVCLVAVIIYSLHTGKDAFGQEVLKTVIPPIITAVGGYYAGKASAGSGSKKE